MSLAMFAAPINDDNTHITDISSNNNTHTNNKIIKPKANNRTQKRKNTSQDISSILQTIHNLPPSDESGLGDFKPLPPPESAGVEQTKYRENTEDLSEDSQSINEYGGFVDHAHKNSMTAVETEDYKRFVPPYKQMYKNAPQNIPYHAPADESLTFPRTYGGGNNELLEKLNYVINLLEQQQDERTNNVTEEIILYSFLGIFIIFLVDSFVRVGKYVR